MDKYDVLISPVAQSDVLGIFEYLATLVPEEAAQYYERLMKDSETLRTAPKNCPLSKDSQLRLRGYRILATEDYLFFFIISGNQVGIRRILHTKRRYGLLT